MNSLQKTKMKKISILGCGWLGLPLAKALQAKEFSVKGSTTSEEKMAVLEKIGIQPFQINLTPTLSKEEGAKTIDFLFDAEILIIDIPPKLRGNLNENFVSKIENIIPIIEKSTVEKVLFVSSTSVYGEANGIVTEATIPNPDTEGGKQLLQVERLLQSNTSFQTTILRFGGLIGEDRNPVKFLAGKTNLEDPDAPINLIHQDDCIGVMLQIIATHSWGETYNAVAPQHPSRAEYYTQKALEKKLALPIFNRDLPSVGKTILSDKVQMVLNYTFTKNLL
jgi:nucleoside-diphosphate-sugar epimerase